MSVILLVLSLTMVAQTLRTTVPYACAALGGVWSERSGVINIALEGLLLASGLASVVVHHAFILPGRPPKCIISAIERRRAGRGRG